MGLTIDVKNIHSCFNWYSTESVTIAKKHQSYSRKTKLHVFMAHDVQHPL